MYPKPSHYPETLRILGQTWQLKLCHKIPGEPASTLGLTVWPDRIIYMKLKQSRKSMAITYQHELMHAVVFQTRCRADHRTIYLLEEGMASAFVDNFIQMVEMAQSALKPVA